MDFIKKFTDKDDHTVPPNSTASEESTATVKSDDSGMSGGFLGSINSALGGGAKGEQKEGA